MLIQLNDLKKCPHCGCTEITSMEVRNKHTNGHWNEDVKFRCGYQAHFSPNFMRIEEKEACSRSKEQIELIDKRKNFLEKLQNYIKKADVDDKFKERINSSIEYVRP